MVGRQYAVDILYSNEPVADYLKASVDAVVNIHSSLEEGDVLVFLTGRYIIFGISFILVRTGQ